MTFHVPLPKRLMKTSASSILGKARTASLNLISISSTAPPKYPVRAPIIIPNVTPISTVARATNSVVAPPIESLANRSLPKLSHPRGWASEGSANLSAALIAFGS